MSTSSDSISQEDRSPTVFTDLTQEILGIIRESANYLRPSSIPVSHAIFTFRLLRDLEEAATNEDAFTELSNRVLAKAAEYDEMLVPGTNSYNDVLSELMQWKHICILILELEKNGEPLRVMCHGTQ